MKSGTWLGGAFVDPEDLSGERSYASGYPEDGDIYIAKAAMLDRETGAFMFDEDGVIVTADGGILVRWEEAEYLEFIDA